MSSSDEMPGHDHCDGHSHAGAGHVHAPASFGTAFAIGITLNLGFVILEFAYGIFAHSLALIADAGHNMGDVLGLVAGLVRYFPGAHPAYRPPDLRTEKLVHSGGSL